VNNPVRKLYETDMEGYLYAAAFHDVISIKEINKLRLNPYEIDAYYNSGVLLMNLSLQREMVNEKEIYDFVEKNRAKLIMPDQDILNALYSKKILSLDEKLYNYNARYFRYYRLVSNGVWNMDHVIRNTVFIHFCGKRKPWKKNYIGKFDSLYKFYEKLSEL
jgi:lipopolysaccharide biosynthesis glycosyltransferase